MTEWQKEMTDRIGRRVYELRGKTSALWLSERTEKLGMKISRSALSELENGKRKSISLAEVFVLAAALDVPPALLIFPDYPDGLVEFLPGVEASSFEASNWVSGDQMYDTGIEDGSPQMWASGFSVVKYSRERANVAEKVLREFVEGDGSNTGSLIELMENRKRELERLIEDAGGVVKNEQG